MRPTPAFPRSFSAFTHKDGSADVSSEGEDGMNLRDWFASTATDADVADYQRKANDTHEVISRVVARYRYADDMLAHR